MAAVNQVVRAKAAAARLGVAAVKAEEAAAEVVEVAVGVAARGEVSRPTLRLSSKTGSLRGTKQRA